MALSSMIEKLGRAIFESPFGANQISKDAPELAEIRLAILDAVKAKSHRAGGRSVFPFNLVRVRLMGIPEEQAQVLATEFLEQYFSEEIREGLQRSNYRFPTDLRIRLDTTPSLPAAGESWLHVETELQNAIPEPESIQAHGIGKLIITNGTANHSELELNKVRTNIGRTYEVFRTAGPSRKNDLFFTEENDVNRTVSREHAHILWSEKSGECRLFNDRVYKGAENCGIWIVRDGLSQPVHRSARGTLLRTGDEIHLGEAVLEFQQC